MPEVVRSAIIERVIFLAGEWVPAWLAMSVTFLVATLGVAGLGWWVLRGDARNRAAEERADTVAQGERIERIERTEAHH